MDNGILKRVSHLELTSVISMFRMSAEGNKGLEKLKCQISLYHFWMNCLQSHTLSIFWAWTTTHHTHTHTNIIK